MSPYLVSERRAWEPGVSVCHRFDARRQEGYGDYTAKKKTGVNSFAEKILRCDTSDQADNRMPCQAGMQDCQPVKNASAGFICAVQLRKLDHGSAHSIPAVRNSSYQRLNPERYRFIIRELFKGKTTMKRIATFLCSLFAVPVHDEDDHLMGAVDLSDSAYCFELLTRHGLH